MNKQIIPENTVIRPETREQDIWIRDWADKHMPRADGSKWSKTSWMWGTWKNYAYDFYVYGAIPSWQIKDRTVITVMEFMKQYPEFATPFLSSLSVEQRDVGEEQKSGDSSCCELNCKNTAKFRIIYGAHPYDDWTDSCEEHIGELMNQEGDNVVMPIEREHPYIYWKGNEIVSKEPVSVPPVEDKTPHYQNLVNAIEEARKRFFDLSYPSRFITEKLDGAVSILDKTLAKYGIIIPSTRDLKVEPYKDGEVIVAPVEDREEMFRFSEWCSVKDYAYYKEAWHRYDTEDEFTTAQLFNEFQQEKSKQ